MPHFGARPDGAAMRDASNAAGGFGRKEDAAHLRREMICVFRDGDLQFY